MDPLLGLRRPTDLQPGLPPESDPQLAARIAAEIDAGGPMTFARFMELALYDPDGGYYTGEQARAGRAGDFLTAPEAHPIFGWALARQVAQLWELLGRPDSFVVREHGAGTGALIAAILDGLAREQPEVLAALRYQPVEVVPTRIEALADRLRAAGHLDRLDVAAAAIERAAPRGSNGAPGPAVDGLILANEILDALPVHRVRGLPDGAIEELLVTHRGGRLEAIAGPPSTPDLASRLAAEGIVLAPGQEAEICLAIDGWIADRAAELERGVLLLIDYGHAAASLYDAGRRPRGTLLAYRGHRAVDSPFTSIGRQDLTAHVDVTAVQRAARAAGLVDLGVTTQAELLASLGAGDLLVSLQNRPGTTAGDYLEARMALVRMLDPAAMGRFRVMAFGRGLPPGAALRAFDFRLPER